ncbi:alpha/beta hydrolase [Isobaculum melis]|uniref:Carboxylesterase n=1 Tax=Isobaculum melis TaxID=142588 RepID=A0A1H9QHZ6_9LACT|nr:alpha/beta fold hydrolase [Isobaculum melis]SER59393.1 carboxylesterase [Isobaculum melis]
MKTLQLPKPFFFEKGKRAILLLHSYTGTSNDFRMLGRFLERHDYTVYAPHFSGHATAHPEDILAHTPEDWWRDTQEALHFLKEKGYEKIAIIGFSLGGMFTMKAAEHFPLVGVGTLCSPLFLSDNSAIQKGFLQYVKEVKTYAGIAPEVIEAEMPQIEQLLTQQLLAISHFLPVIQEQLKEIRIPTLICQSGKDELIDANNAYLLEEALENSQTSFHWYKNSGHVITIGEDRHVLQEDILAFLNGLQWNEETK